MSLFKNFIKVGAAAFFFSVAAAAAQDVRSLQPGTYVRVGTPCQNPSNSVTMNFDGKKFFGGRFCGVPEGTGASSKLKPCQSEGTDGEGGVTVVTALAFGAFSFKNGLGAFDFRHCSEAELRGAPRSEPPLRAAPSTAVAPQLANLDTQDRMLVSMVLGQSEIKAIGFTGWQTIKGPFNYIGVTKQDKSASVFVRSSANEWVKVDCSVFEGGGGICYMASLMYTGFFSK